jgi:hypothetical protein
LAKFKEALSRFTNQIHASHSSLAAAYQCSFVPFVPLSFQSRTVIPACKNLPNDVVFMIGGLTLMYMSLGTMCVASEEAFLLALGSSDFDKFFDNCYASCSFQLEKIFKTVLEKVFFFVLWPFYLFFMVLVLKNLENSSSKK